MGPFPGILGQYVREERLFTLEEAVRKMTSKAATRVHLNDRGILRPGITADITIFDPATIHDVATFERRTTSAGVHHVFVNGNGSWPTARLPSGPGGRCADRDIARAR